MNIFTNDDYRKIQAWLKANAIKDSDLAQSESTIPDKDIITIVQKVNGIPTNFKINIKDFLNSSLNKIIIQLFTANAIKVNNSLVVDVDKIIINEEENLTLQAVFDRFEDNKLNRHTDDTFDGNLTIKKNITIEGNIKSNDGTTTVEADLKATGEITDGDGNILSDVNDAAKQWSLEYQDPQQDEPTVRAKYVLKDYKGVPKGNPIKVYKDSAITNVYLGTTEDTCNENTGEVTKKPIQNNNEALSIVYRLDTGKYSLVNVPIGIFIREAEFDKYRGLGITENGQVFIKLANDVESSNYLHFNDSGELSADGIENRILQDLGTIINSVADDGTMWGQYKKEEGTKDSPINEASRWGQYKQAEANRNERLNSFENKIEEADNEIKASLEAETKRAQSAEQAIIYDVSARNNGAVFESISALLSASNLSTLIPTSVRMGGMTIRFIQSSDNRYVQYRLMSQTFSTTESDWQGVDNEPTAGSNNLVKSGGVYDVVNHPRYINVNPEIIENKYFSFGGINTSYYGVQWDGKFLDNEAFRKISSCLITVNSGDKYLLTATTPWTYWGNTYPTIVFFDLDNVIIKFSIAVFANTPITVPDGAVKMGIMFHPDYNFLLKKDTLPELDSIETEIIESDIIKSLRIRENYSFKVSGINTSGKVGTVASMSPISSTNLKSVVIKCKEKDIFYVEVQRNVYGSSSIWVFLDNNNTILATSENLYPNPNVVGNVESYTGYIVAPKNTVKLVVNADNRNKAILHGIYNTQDVGNMSIKDFAPVYLTSTEVTKMTPSIGNIKIGDNVSINGDEDSTVSDYYVRAFSVSGEDVIKISTFGFAIILDEENNVIYNTKDILQHYIGYTFNKGNNILVMPSNAKTLLLYYYVLSKISPEAEIIGNYKRVLDLDNDNIGINETWRLSSGSTFSTMPNVGDHAPQTDINKHEDFINTAYFECTEGDIFSIQSETGGNVFALITDENDIVLVKDSNAAGYLNITAPSGASHIFIQVQQTDVFNKYNGRVFRNSIIEQQAVTINQFTSNSIYPYDFVVAPTFYAVKGYQKNVYQDSLICGLDCGLDSPSGLYINISSSISDSYGFRSRSLRVSPTTTGTYTLRLEAYNSYLNRVKDKSVNLVVSDAVGLNNNHNVIIIGDSLIAGGGIAKFTRDRFSELGGVTPTFVGSKSSTVDGEIINHEGIGGVKMGYFSSTSSPFYIGGKLDVTAYKVANNIVGDIDLVVFQLGVNDAILGGVGDTRSLIPIINAFLEDSPNCKFIVQMTTADANTQGAGWEVYGANNRYKMSFTRNIWNTRKSILDTFNTAEWKGTVYIGDALVGLDRYYGYPYEITKDNEWEPVEEFHHTNSVHPNEYGNRMLADGYFFLMLYILQNMES